MELWRESLDDDDALLPLLNSWKASLPEGPRSEAWLDAIATLAIEPQENFLTFICEAVDPHSYRYLPE